MKTSSSILLSLLAIFLQGSCADIYKHTASNYCVVNEADPNSWLNCDGKVVKVKGNLAAPAEIMQHPMLDTPPMLAPSMDESAALIKRTVQNYMNLPRTRTG